MSVFQSVKFWLVEHAGLGKDALHIYVGMAVLLLAVIVFRWPLKSWKPWLVVLAVAIAGEIWDIVDRIRDGIAIGPGGHWKDIWNTLFWPTVLTLLARYTKLLRR